MTVAALTPLRQAIGERTVAWGILILSAVVGYYMLQLIAVSIGLWQIPNYFVWYDYIGNVQRIFEGTPSLSDALKIMQGEWLIEAGHKSYDFGKGVALWSLNVQPMRILLISLAGGMVAACILMLLHGRAATSGRRSTRFLSIGAVAAGTLLVAISNATLSWVVACLSPSWIATLHMIGLDAFFVDSIEPYGSAVAYAGFASLSAGTYGLSWSLSERPSTARSFAQPVVQE